MEFLMDIQFLNHHNLLLLINHNYHFLTNQSIFNSESEQQKQQVIKLTSTNS